MQVSCQELRILHTGVGVKAMRSHKVFYLPQNIFGSSNSKEFKIIMLARLYQINSPMQSFVLSYILV